VEQHRRVASLNRELESAENQGFEMGPSRRPSSGSNRTDFSRGHALGKETAANVGIPFGPGQPAQASVGGGDTPRNNARKSTLMQERQAADQGLEWVPSAAALGKKDFSRLKAQRKEEGESYDFLPGAARNAVSAATGSDGDHGRRNVLNRELSSIQSIDMPRNSGNDGAVPSYGRAAALARENPVGFQRVGAKVLAH